MEGVVKGGGERGGKRGVMGAVNRLKERGGKGECKRRGRGEKGD